MDNAQGVSGKPMGPNDGRTEATFHSLIEQSWESNKYCPDSSRDVAEDMEMPQLRVSKGKPYSDFSTTDVRSLLPGNMPEIFTEISNDTCAHALYRYRV